MIMNRPYMFLGALAIALAALPQSRAGTPRRGSLLYKAVAATDYNGWYTLENPVGDTYNDTVRQVALLKAWLSEARRGKSAE